MASLTPNSNLQLILGCVDLHSYLDMVSEVGYVGPFVYESYLMRLEKGEKQKTIALGGFTDTALREYKEKDQGT
jgi:hypothetical protein